MKRIHILVSVLSVILILGCLTGCKSTTKESKTGEDYSIDMTDDLNKIKKRGYLKVAVKDDVPEFGLYNKKKKAYEGGEIDLAYYIAAKIFDVTYDEAKEKNLVHFQKVRTNQRETVLTDDKVDYVIATYTITDARKKKVDFSDSYYQDAVGLMVNKDHGDSNSLRDTSKSVSKLDGKKVGVVKGSTTRKDLRDYIEQNNLRITPMFFVYNTYDQLDKALDQGNIDAFCVDTSILNGYINSNREILTERFAPQNYGVASSKDKKGLVEVVNTVIKELQHKKIVLF